MSRPKPDVLLEKIDKNTYKSEQVLASDGIWSVYYQARAINLKSYNILVNYPGPKYKKSSFQNSGHAFNLSDRLNVLFKTDLFTVVKLTEGEVISRGET